MKQQNFMLNTLPFLILPPLFWAGNFVVGKAIHADIPPFSLAFLRWVIAFLVILPFAWKFIQRDQSLYQQHYGRILATAIIGVTCFNSLIYKGLHDTTTTNALLLNSCIPILIILFGRLFYAQKLQILQIVGLIVSLFGVFNIILQGDLQRLFTLSFNSGDLWVFLAIVCWAFYTIWTKSIPTDINKIGLTAIQMLVAIIALFPLFLWEYFSQQTMIFNTQSILGLAYVGIFPSVIAYVLYTLAIEKVGAVKAGLSIHLIPVFGVLLSISLLGETFQFYHAMGIALIALGLILCHRK
ncbi:DMT family transporter [Moraxella sp. ZY210820]|uniref:DMT family transporter n=1 Tax=unclassified Moraxella TaxID=2685852 RepID=UPI00272FD3E8|nr:DMT family transporter [Moraxella sp. ZY210820]WLF83096.1 DMT family transporter [Moraxella sp. ZY210820]